MKNGSGRSSIRVPAWRRECRLDAQRRKVLEKRVGIVYRIAWPFEHATAGECSVRHCSWKRHIDPRCYRRGRWERELSGGHRDSEGVQAEIHARIRVAVLDLEYRRKAGCVPNFPRTKWLMARVLADKLQQ